MGDDPYEAVLEKLALWLITHEAKRFDTLKEPALLLEMGDILYSCGAYEAWRTPSNCLIATGESASLRMVKNYYHEAALEDKEDILNPVCYSEEAYIAHIPKALRFRGYGQALSLRQS